MSTTAPSSITVNALVTPQDTTVPVNILANVCNGGGYRYGYNGQIKDNEIAGVGNHYSALYWEYDPRTARRWNIDPVDQISISNYAINGNSPILLNDPKGDCFFCPWLDAVVDAAFVVYDVGVLVYDKATTGTTNPTDWAALGADAASIVVPMSTGAGVAVRASAKVAKAEKAAIKVSKAADKVIDAEKNVNKIVDAKKGIEKVENTATKKVHGNKLNDKPAEGYTLRDKETGNVKKFGETTRGEDRYGSGKQKRYSKRELQEKGVDYQKEVSGTKKDMHKWQHDNIKDYKDKNNGKRPDLNKSDY